MIKFPEIGLELHINKIAFSILGINIYWYAILIVLSMCISLIILKINNKNEKIEYEKLLELFIYLIPISIISARIYYVIFEYQNYINKPITELINIKSGGLAIYGGIIGGLITTIIYCKIRKINFIYVLDEIVPCLALGQAIGRWGNFINIEAYGIETQNIFRMGIYENGIYKEVHPTFLYESIIDILIFIILICVGNKRKIKGERTLIYLILYSCARFFIEGIRNDSLMLYNIKISQLLSLVIFIISCSIYLCNKIKCRKK